MDNIVEQMTDGTLDDHYVIMPESVWEFVAENVPDQGRAQLEAEGIEPVPTARFQEHLGPEDVPEE